MPAPAIRTQVPEPTLEPMKSIRARLMIWVGLVAGAGVVAWSVGFYQLVVLWTREDLVEKLDNRVLAFAFTVDPRRPIYEARFDRGFRPEVSGMLYLLYDTNGTVIGKSTGVSEVLGLSPQVRDQSRPFSRPFREETALPGGTRFRVATYPVFRRDGPEGSGGKWDDPGQLTTADRPVVAWAQVGTAVGGLHDRHTRLRAWLWLAGAGLFAGITAGVYFLSGQWLRSLRVATVAAERAGTHDLGALRLAVPVDEPEIARLAAAFNRLLERLGQAHAAQQRLIADAAHELRTPLTILRGEIQVALRRDRSPERYREILRSNAEEVARLCRIVDHLLTLAQTDAGEQPPRHTSVDLSALVTEVCGRFSSVATASGITLRCDAPAEALVLGDRTSLHSVVSNLIDNAVRHSPPEEAVEVRVRVPADTGEVLVEVADHGAGIGPEHLPHLFERFYRVDQARGRDRGGAGLGLAIVQALVTAHGGRVSVRSDIGVGTTFSVVLPRAPAPAESR
jgi:heavy metal sensor kinase